MTKIYMVEMKIQVAVAAEDEDRAYYLADYQMFRDALGDTTWDGIDIAVLEEITHVDQLEMYGWDGKCIPYGDTGGNTRIEEILK